MSKYSRIINEASEKYNIDPKIIQAVIKQESGGDPKEVSPKGAKGLMQLMDGTAEMLGVSDSLDVRQNIFGGTKYLASLMKKYDGDIKQSLAAYNSGPGTVDKYGGIPPFAETRKYVENIVTDLALLTKSTKNR